MSRSRRKLEALREATRSRRRVELPVEHLNRREKITIWILGAATMFLMASTPIFQRHLSLRQQVNTRVETWRLRYDLSENQASKVRETELEYQQRYLSFFSTAKPSRSEKERHLAEIASLMEEDAAAKFIRDHILIESDNVSSGL